MSFLERIRPAKQREADALRAAHARRTPVRDGPPVRDFAAALRGGARLVAEVKRRAPSAPDFVQKAALDRLAAVYERSGAAAVSVVTDRDHFGSSLADVPALRAATALPVLTKDFVLDEAQIDAAWAAGADAVLLIARFVTPGRLAELRRHAEALGLAALVECHDEDEIAAALAAGARLVGLNNRDLAALTTDVATTTRLLPHVPDDVLTVSESGLERREQIVALAEAGADAFLVGHALLRHPDPGRKVRQLVGREPERGPLLKVCGLTTVDDALLADAAGAHVLGVIFAPSPRRVTPERAAAIRRAVPGARLCGVFRDENPAQVAAVARTAGLDLLQLHGDESPAVCRDLRLRTGLPVIKVLEAGSPLLERADAYDTAYLLVDRPKNGAPPPDGVDARLVAAAQRLRDAGREVLLAGGLGPADVRAALAAGAAGVDVCRGVESAPGRKDPALLRALAREVRS